MNKYREALISGGKFAEGKQDEALKEAEEAGMVRDVLMRLSDTRERNDGNIKEELKRLRKAKSILDYAIRNLEEIQNGNKTGDKTEK